VAVPALHARNWTASYRPTGRAAAESCCQTAHGFILDAVTRLIGGLMLSQLLRGSRGEGSPAGLRNG
jgi:hypothetical protein